MPVSPSTPASWTRQLAEWAASLSADDIPDDVWRASQLRVLDVVGLALAGAATPYGRSVTAAAAALHGGGAARPIGSADRLTVPGAAFVTAALSQALEFDDTHLRSVVHMSSPSVAVGLAVAAAARTSGRSVLAAVAVGNEISARVGSVVPQQFHRRGFHPTAMFAPFGATFAAGRLGGLDAQRLVQAAGIVGSLSAGLLQCWVDGTQTKFLHSGFAAQSGLSAAALARAGVTGPAEVLEGRWGLFAAHLQDEALELDVDALLGDLGVRWESRAASFKPYPAAHVIHPYLDAILRLRREGLRAEDVAAIECPVAGYQLGIVGAPAAEKERPLTAEHGRVSLQFSLAEALVSGRLDRNSYGDAARADPVILGLAERIQVFADPAFPGPERYTGEVRVRTRDGRLIVAREEQTRGAPGNPMSDDDLIAKFRDNASASLGAEKVDALLNAILQLETHPDAGDIVRLATPAV